MSYSYYEDLELLRKFQLDKQLNRDSVLTMEQARRLVAAGYLESVGIALQLTPKALDLLSN